jgi:hypothetical protein
MRRWRGAARKVGPARADAFAMARQQPGQRRRIRRSGFPVRAPAALLHRRAAAAGDRDLQRTRSTRAGTWKREFGINHRVGEDAARIGGSTTARFVRIVCGGDHQPARPASGVNAPRGGRCALAFHAAVSPARERARQR